MAKLSVKPGTTSLTVYLFIQNSSVTTGAGLTGLVFNSASLVASYVRPLAARAAITLVTQTVTGAWTSGGFVEVDSTNMAGWYRLDVPDAAIATGVRSAGLHLKGATNMVDCPLELDLTNDSNVVQLNGSIVDALTFSRIMSAALTGTVITTVTPTTTVVEFSDITEATANQYIGRQCCWATGILKGQTWGYVTAYSLVSGRGRLTMSPGSLGTTSEIPGNGDIAVFV